ncbi:MAG: 3-hydroxyacyl-CoA dehydrogenase family protein [Rhodothermaceae bacterium]
MSESKLKLEDLISNVAKTNDQDRIENVAIIGAGLMGQGIAQTIAGAGFEVTVVELNDDLIETAKNSMENTMKREIARWAMTGSEMKSVMSRIKFSTNLDDAKDAELVIESINEDVKAKQELFSKLDELVQEKAVFVTNTSSLGLGDISSKITRKDKFIGMHFLSPVPKIPLIEVIKDFHTSDNTLEVIKAFAKSIKKTAVEVFEYPGFITTRAIVPMLNEAMHIYLEGLASAEDIDTAMKLGYNFNIGPLALADHIGLDEVLGWMDTLWQTLGETRFRPCPLLRRLVRERKLGVKTGEGFFKYDEDGKVIA